MKRLSPEEFKKIFPHQNYDFEIRAYVGEECYLPTTYQRLSLFGGLMCLHSFCNMHFIRIHGSYYDEQNQRLILYFLRDDEVKDLGTLVL